LIETNIFVLLELFGWNMDMNPAYVQKYSELKYQDLLWFWGNNPGSYWDINPWEIPLSLY